MITFLKNILNRKPNINSINNDLQKMKDQLDKLVDTNVAEVSRLHEEIMEREAIIQELDTESGKAIQITNHLDKLLGN